MRFLPGLSFAEMRGLLALAWVAVLPRTSPYGFPIKLVNYLAAGKTIVAFRLAAPFLAEPPTTFLVEEISAKRLAGGIVTLLRDQSLRAALGVAARRAARETYRWGRTVACLETVYLAMLEAGR